jgi:hypothetical protein
MEEIGIEETSEATTTTTQSEIHCEKEVQDPLRECKNHCEAEKCTASKFHPVCEDF